MLQFCLGRDVSSKFILYDSERFTNKYKSWIYGTFVSICASILRAIGVIDIHSLWIVLIVMLLLFQ
jgi:hypothetical protein